MTQPFRKFFGELDEQDRIELLVAPYYAALEIAGADGTTDQEELTTLWAWQIGQAEMVDEDFVTAMDKYSVQIVEFRGKFLAPASKTGKTNLRKASKIRGEMYSRIRASMIEMPEHLCMAYKRYLLEGLFKVASASGESIFESWQKIDESEIQKIHALLEEFDVSLMDLLRFVATKNFS